MGFLDEAKDRLGEAAEWVHDTATGRGREDEGADPTLGERAADAARAAEGRVGGAQPERTGGGGSFATEWAEASPSTEVGADAAPRAQDADPAPDAPTA